MIELTAGLIDVFADQPLRGNPLAVVEDADALTETQMRRVAAEFAQAETTFLLASTRADRRLRSFTARGVEVFGAGHNALGAWLWLAEHGRLGPLNAPTTWRQEIGPDVLPITLERIAGQVRGRMQQSPLRLGPVVSDLASLAAALKLTPDDIMPYPPPRAADTGAAHLMLRLRDPAAVDRAEPDSGRLLAALTAAGAEGCYVYAFDPATPGTAFARFFNPTVGLWEDAATGTAAGPLSAYLGAEGLLGPDRSLVIEQGTKLGRQSFLQLRLTPDPELSGRGCVSLRGRLLVD